MSKRHGVPGRAAIAALAEPPQVPQQLVPVTIQAVGARGIAAWLIEHYGFGLHGYSHVDIVLPDGNLLGARTDYPVDGKTGVQVRAAGYAAKDWVRRTRVTFMVSPLIAAAAYDFARAQVGDPYAKQDIVDLVFGVKDQQRGRWICSWLAAAFLGKAHAICYPGMPLSQVSPDTLVACACAAGGIRSELPVA